MEKKLTNRQRQAIETRNRILTVAMKLFDEKKFENVSMEEIAEQAQDVYKRQLLEASMVIGAVMAGASKEECATVERMAAAIGLAFQIQDDILDVTSSQEVLGKPVRSDEKNNKTTYVSLEGIEKARRDVEKLSDTAVDILYSLPGKNDFLEELIKMLVSREK